LEIPPAQLRRIERFIFGEADPNEDELQTSEISSGQLQRRVEWLLGYNRLDSWTSWGLDVSALSKAMLRGRYPATNAIRESQDAEHLMALLQCFRLEAFPIIQEVVERKYKDVTTWGQQALRAIGWSREAWVSPLVATIEQSDGEPRRFRFATRMLKNLGPAVGTAVPELVKLSRELTDRFQADLIWALDDIGRIPGVLIPASSRFDLVKILEASNQKRELKIAAARILGCTGLALEPAVRFLLEIALKEATSHRLAEAILFGNYEGGQLVGEPGIKSWHIVGLSHLLFALQAHDKDVRCRAIGLLGCLGPEAKDAIPALEEAAKLPELRSRVQNAILLINSPALVSPLRHLDSVDSTVIAPGLDVNESRDSQYFEFICPKCQLSEPLLRWYSLRQCPRCMSYIRIVQQE
jgi:hypothetical protein